MKRTNLESWYNPSLYEGGRVELPECIQGPHQKLIGWDLPVEAMETRFAVVGETFLLLVQDLRDAVSGNEI